jgi:nicotinate-nucleotide adenylyltransferase
METIALFGGSFDPPHIGHRAIVEHLLELDFIDKVVVMPTYLNPFKHKIFADGTLRVDWLRKIFKKNDDVIVSTFEVDMGRKVASIESVEYLLKSYKKVYLVIGADNLSSLSKWKDFEKLSSLVEFIVASRDGVKIEDKYIKLPLSESISSSSLRERMQREKLPQECAVEIEKFYKDINER